MEIGARQQPVRAHGEMLESMNLSSWLGSMIYPSTLVFDYCPQKV
jgi:hypothetical protein